MKRLGFLLIASAMLLPLMTSSAFAYTDYDWEFQATANTQEISIPLGGTAPVTFTVTGNPRVVGTSEIEDNDELLYFGTSWDYSEATLWEEYLPFDGPWQFTEAGQLTFTVLFHNDGMASGSDITIVYNVEGVEVDTGASHPIPIPIHITTPGGEEPPPVPAVPHEESWWTGNPGELASALGSGVWLGTGSGYSNYVDTTGEATEILKYGGKNGLQKLARKLLCAKLNGAPVVLAGPADSLLANYNAASWGSFSKSVQRQINNTADALDVFNHGL